GKGGLPDISDGGSRSRAVPDVMVVLVLHLAETTDTMRIHVRVSSLHRVEGRQHAVELLDMVRSPVRVATVAEEDKARPPIMHMGQGGSPFNIVQLWYRPLHPPLCS